MRICAALLQEEHFREVTLLRAGRKLMSIQVVYKCLVHVDDPDSYALSSLCFYCAYHTSTPQKLPDMSHIAHAVFVRF